MEAQHILTPLLLLLNLGDEEKPKCKRCVQKNLPCSRPTKKTIFRKGASIHFDKNQKWVNSQARQCKLRWISVKRLCLLRFPNSKQSVYRQRVNRLLQEATAAQKKRARPAGRGWAIITASHPLPLLPKLLLHKRRILQKTMHQRSWHSFNVPHPRALLV